MPFQFYTAQYRYSGDDRVDITVKGQDPIGKIFAPTWSMVMGVKDGTMSWLEYCEKYTDMMAASIKNKPVEWMSIVKSDGPLTFVCYCKEAERCHRWLLAGILQQLGAKYLGEREL